MLNQKLNVLLANYVVAHQKLLNLHWYVKGSSFFRAHEKFEEYYTEFNEAIDVIAELILMNGGKPCASLKEYLEISNVCEREDSYLDIEDAIAIIKFDFETILSAVKNTKTVADEENNYLISAAMDDLIASLSKHIWMLSQYQM